MRSVNDEAVFSTKSNLAYNVVRRMILSGELSAGSVINQTLIAKMIGMSTTPLREALGRLSSEQLIRMDPHRDATVAELTAEEARDIFEVRQGLEPMAAAFAVARYDVNDESAMRDAASRLRPIVEGSNQEDLDAHRWFHATIYRASHNSILISLLEDLWDKRSRYQLLGLNLLIGSGAQRTRDFRDHFAILDAVLARDAAKASELVHNHVQGGLHGLALHALADEDVAKAD